MHRVLNLLRAEWVKVTRQLFFTIALILSVVVPIVWALGARTLAIREPAVFGSPHAILFFASAARAGFFVVTVLILIFSSMLFAGEFDRGTIKLLLTRPITRTEYFLAKLLMLLLLTILLLGAMVYSGLLISLVTGELGGVWDKENYYEHVAYETLVRHALKALSMSLLPVLAACLMGVLISNLVDSSGYAVAASLSLFIVLDFLSRFTGPGTGRYLFTYYPGYAFDILRAYSEGTSTRWHPDLDARFFHLKICAGYCVGFVIPAFAAFRFKNVHV